MYKRTIAKLLCFALMLSMMPASAQNQISDEWDLDGLIVRVNAEVVLNPEETGYVIKTRVKQLSASDLPSDMEEGSETISGELYTLGDMGEVAALVYSLAAHVLDIMGWEKNGQEIEGFPREMAAKRASTLLAALGLDPAEPYVIDTLNRDGLAGKLEQYIGWGFGQSPEVSQVLDKIRALIDADEGFYLIYFPLRFQGISLMPNQIHAKDHAVMGGARAVVGLTDERVIYVYIENAPEQEGIVLRQGAVIPVEEAIEGYQSHVGNILYEDNESIDLFKIAYEYVPENTAGKEYDQPILYPAWCFYHKITGDSYTKQLVIAFDALTGKWISSR